MGRECENRAAKKGFHIFFAAFIENHAGCFPAELLLANAYVERDAKYLLSHTVLTTQGCKTHPSTPPPAVPSGPGIGKFQTGGPPCTTLGDAAEIGNSGLKIIEGRHQPGPRFEARTFVPEVIDKHRVKVKHRFARP